MDNFATLFNGALNFICNLGNWFYRLWTTSFTIGDISVSFPQIVGSALIVLMALYLVKKFVPLV